jgi:hypothetical protein
MAGAFAWSRRPLGSPVMADDAAPISRVVRPANTEGGLRPARFRSGARFEAADHPCERGAESWSSLRVPGLARDLHPPPVAARSTKVAQSGSPTTPYTAPTTWVSRVESRGNTAQSLSASAAIEAARSWPVMPTATKSGIPKPGRAQVCTPPSSVQTRPQTQGHLGADLGKPDGGASETPRPGTTHNCAPTGRLAIAADLPIC